MFSIFVLILLLVSFFNFVYFPWKQKQQVTHALQVRAESSAMMMAAGVTLALEKGDFEFIGELLTFSKGDEGILYIAVCDEEYQPAVSFNPQAVKIPSAAFFAGANTIERDNVLHTTSALETEDANRILVVGFSLDERDRAIDEIRLTGFLVTSATLVFGLLLSIYLSRSMINPLSRLVDSIDHISKTEDYETTIEKGSTDEVGKLIDSFNEMTRTLQTRTVERRQAVETLEESEGRFRSLVQTAGAVILLLAPDHRILEWNREAERIYGWRREEVLGKNYVTHFLPEETRRDITANMEKVLSGEPTVGNVNPIITRDGTQRLLQWNVVRILDADGDPIGIMACGQDITERQHLEDQLRQLQKMEAIGQLTAGVAHNFNNMLLGIIGNVDLALEKAPAHVESFLRDANRASERAAAIVKQLMLFTRAGDSVPAKPVEIQRILSETVDMCRITFDRRIEIVISVSGPMPVVMGDSDQLQQVFLNLLLNARDAVADESCLDPRIEIVMDLAPGSIGKIASMASNGDCARIRIRDNGIGMDEKTAARVFEPFFTTKETGRGTGLGLSTAYAIVRQHQGWIEHESRVGAGTVFSVHLPSVEPRGTPQVAEPKKTAPGGTETILVIDDEAMIRRLLDSQLSAFGYTVLLGENGNDGLEVFGRHMDEISLVLLDISMPTMSGREVLPALRVLSPHIKVIIFTGYAADPVEFPDAQALIQKPFAKESLAGKVREVLDA